MKLKTPVIAAVLFICWAAVLAAGLSSHFNLGDEVHHYQFARDAFTMGGRPLVHSLFADEYANAIRYTTDPGWPMTLAAIWKLTGKISSSTAQLFHSLFYLLLSSTVYTCSRKLYGKPAAIWATLLTLTAPMLVSFGILFYTDLPAVALTCTSFAFLAHKRYFSAGAAMAVAFLFKKTAALFFLPALALIFFMERENWKKILFSLVSYGFLPVAAALHEQSWLARHFNSLTAQDLSQRLDIIYRTGEKPLPARIAGLFQSREFSNSSLYNLSDIFKYFGLAIFAGLGIYFRHHCFERKDLVLWLFILFYLAGVFFLRLIPDLRYLMLAVPLLCALASKGLARISSKISATAIILICFVQLGAAALYTNSQRKVPPAAHQGFDWIQSNTPEGSVIMYPELNIMEYTHRPMVWGLFEVRDVFWGTPEERKKELQKASVGYIAVLKSRIYNDEKVRHIGGYPTSFLAQLPALNYLSKVYENEKISVWKIDQDLLKR